MERRTHTPSRSELNGTIARDIRRVRTLQKLSREDLALRAALSGPEEVGALEDEKKDKLHQIPQIEAVYEYLRGQEGPGLDPDVVVQLREIRARLEQLLGEILERPKAKRAA